MTSTTHLNDTGVDFQITVKDKLTKLPLDLSDVSLCQFLFQKPSGEILTVEGELLNDGTDGIAHYISLPGDLDEVGTWKYQALVVFDDPYDEQHSDVVRFRVLPNLPI